MSSASSAITVPARSVTARRACVAPRSAASTIPAPPLKLSSCGGRPPVEAASASETSRFCCEQRVDALGDRRAREPGRGHEVAARGRRALRGSAAARRRRRRSCSGRFGVSRHRGGEPTDRRRTRNRAQRGCGSSCVTLARPLAALRERDPRRVARRGAGRSARPRAAPTRLPGRIRTARDAAAAPAAAAGDADAAADRVDRVARVAHQQRERAAAARAGDARARRRAGGSAWTPG